MFKLPFGLLPGHWGLAGKTREIAKAEYELKGYDLNLQLLRIKEDEFEPDEFTRRICELDFTHGKITENVYHRKLANLIKDPTQQALATLEIDYREGKITDTEYAKQLATLKKEPWVTVLNMDFGKTSAVEGSFELDWNEFFVEKLKSDGYTGPTPDIIVNQWFMEVCRNVAMEEFDGTGDFTGDSEANLAAMKRWQGRPEPLGPDRKGYR